VKEQDWIENTIKTPFYRNQGPIEVMLLDQTTRIIKCPACSQRMFQYVIKWRKPTPPDPSHH